MDGELYGVRIVMDVAVPGGAVVEHEMWVQGDIERVAEKWGKIVLLHPDLTPVSKSCLTVARVFVSSLEWKLTLDLNKAGGSGYKLVAAKVAEYMKDLFPFAKVEAIALIAHTLQVREVQIQKKLYEATGPRTEGA